MIARERAIVSTGSPRFQRRAARAFSSSWRQESFGAYAGIAEAVLDSEKKTLEAVTEGKKSSRQLDREIDEFMRARRR